MKQLLNEHVITQMPQKKVFENTGMQNCFLHLAKHVALHPMYFVALVLLFLNFGAMAQDTVTATPVIKLSTQKQKIDGQEYYIHVVEKGQTLFSIARAYRSKYQNTIHKSDIDKIAIGDTIWIPFVPTTTEKTGAEDYFKYYEVKKGETLYSISKQFGFKEADIIEMNPVLQTEPLKTGQVIKIKQENKTTLPISKPQQIKGGVLDVKPISKNDTIEDITTEPDDTLVIKDLVDPNTVHVALLMPFNLDLAKEISISKVDIEQKRKRSYKSFQFIHFYESMLLGIEKLEELGYSVKLHVYDVSENDSKAVEKIFEKPEMQKIDFIIALLYQNAFETAAKYAKYNNTFIINPLSNRSAITDKNPYVFKIAPSDKAYVSGTLAFIENNFDDPNLILIYSDKSSADSAIRLNFREQLREKKTIPYTMFNWLSTTSFSTNFKPDKNNIVISLYDQGSQKNQVYANHLINRLASVKKNKPILFADENLLDYESLYPSLQRITFYFSDNFYLSDNNPNHKPFLDLFRETYKTEPDARYASTGYDIILYFVSGLQTNGKKFWTKPTSIPPGVRLLNPFSFKQPQAGTGFENSRVIFYKLENYEIVPALKKTK